MKRSYSLIALCVTVLISFFLTVKPSHALEAKKFVRWEGETPPLKLKDSRGNPVSLEQYRGKVIIVNFWATWCGPCVEEMPSLQKLRDRVNGQSAAGALEVIAVNLGESPEKVNQFAQKSGVTVPLLLDRDEAAKEAWKVSVVPATFIIGADGKMQYVYVGGANWASDEMVKRINAIVAGKN
ncbi:MAG: TlpA disulfide reductase family protein [Pseudomonadota bacterium]